MDKAAYEGMLEIIDESLDVARQALAAAEEAEKQARVQPTARLLPPNVTLVKVARTHIEKTASVLQGTGVFGNT